MLSIKQVDLFKKSKRFFLVKLTWYSLLSLFYKILFLLFFPPGVVGGFPVNFTDAKHLRWLLKKTQKNIIFLYLFI